VEDDEDTRELLVELLRDQGAQVPAASNGHDGLARIKVEGVDVVLSDIAMPGMDGYELIRSTRRLHADEGGRVPAIAVTANCAPEDRLLALRAGYSMHLSKPVDLGVLVRSITALALGDN
jgi:CheY-like chemotaxis protein